MLLLAEPPVKQQDEKEDGAEQEWTEDDASDNEVRAQSSDGEEAGGDDAAELEREKKLLRSVISQLGGAENDNGAQVKIPLHAASVLFSIDVNGDLAPMAGPSPWGRMA
jgi:hypothetical protein